MLDQLESILRHVAEELAGWRARAVKAEADLKEIGARGGGGGGGAAAARVDADVRGRVVDLEQENRVLRQRVEAARLRMQDLLSRLTFLEEQARQSGGNGGVGAGAGGVSGASGASGASGVSGGAGMSPGSGGGTTA